MPQTAIFYLLHNKIQNDLVLMVKFSKYFTKKALETSQKCKSALPTCTFGIFLTEIPQGRVYSFWNPGLFRAVIYPRLYCSQRPRDGRDKSTDIPSAGGLQTTP